MPEAGFVAVDRLTAGEARRVALAAQGFAGARRPERPDAGHVLRLVRRLGLLQIDSVNVLVRSHYLPLFSRLGAYRPALLDGLAYGRKRGLFEYWGHEASLLPLETQPLLRWRMARAADGEGVYGETARFGRERRAFVDEVLAEVRDRGPLAASELAGGGPGKGSWWGWSDGKRALEFLFWSGRVATATRRNFERVYDLSERVLPAQIQALPTPAPAEAQRRLLEIAARALGVATEADLRDYFRLGLADNRAALAELVEAGTLLPVEVAGWGRPAYLHREARRPRRVQAQALLSPFDSLVWERARTERLFGFRFRLEIYTPAAKREHGYYVLPFLFGDRLVGRVDLKADRPRRLLLLQAAHAEPGVPHEPVAAALAEELRRLAGWLGLQDVHVVGPGDLAPAVRPALLRDGGGAVPAA